MKFIILILLVLIGIVLYFLFNNIMKYLDKNERKKEDPMSFYNTYEPKYTNEKNEYRNPIENMPLKSRTSVRKLPECFNVLNFTEVPTMDELKKRYRTLAKENHPDRGGDPEKFEQITKAYKEAETYIKS